MNVLNRKNSLASFSALGRRSSDFSWYLNSAEMSHDQIPLPWGRLELEDPPNREQRRRRDGSVRIRSLPEGTARKWEGRKRKKGRGWAKVLSTSSPQERGLIAVFSRAKSAGSGVGSLRVHEPVSPSPSRAHTTQSTSGSSQAPHQRAARPPTCAAPAPAPRALSRSAPPPASNLAPTEVALEDVLRRLTSAWRGVAGVRQRGGTSCPAEQNFRPSRKTLSLAVSSGSRLRGWEGRSGTTPVYSWASGPRPFLGAMVSPPMRAGVRAVGGRRPGGQSCAGKPAGWPAEDGAGGSNEMSGRARPYHLPRGAGAPEEATSVQPSRWICPGVRNRWSEYSWPVHCGRPWGQVVPELTLPGCSPSPFSAVGQWPRASDLRNAPGLSRWTQYLPFLKGSTRVTERNGQVSLSFRLGPWEIGKGLKDKSLDW